MASGCRLCRVRSLFYRHRKRHEMDGLFAQTSLDLKAMLATLMALKRYSDADAVDVEYHRG